MELFKKLKVLKSGTSSELNEDMEYSNAQRELSRLKKELKKQQGDFFKTQKQQQRELDSKMMTETSIMRDQLMKLSDIVTRELYKYNESQKINNTVHLKIGEGLQALNSKISALDRLIDDKNEEIKSYQDGYRDKVNARVYRELIAINESVSELKDVEKIKWYVSEKIEQILYDNDIIMDDPLIGSDFDRSRQKCIETIDTKDEKLNKKIARVEKPGYFVELGKNRKKYLTLPQVVLYVINENQEVE